MIQYYFYFIDRDAMHKLTDGIFYDGGTELVENKQRPVHISLRLEKSSYCMFLLVLFDMNRSYIKYQKLSSYYSSSVFYWIQPNKCLYSNKINFIENVEHNTQQPTAKNLPPISHFPPPPTHLYFNRNSTLHKTLYKRVLDI